MNYQDYPGNIQQGYNPYLNSGIKEFPPYQGPPPHNQTPFMPQQHLQGYSENSYPLFSQQQFPSQPFGQNYQNSQSNWKNQDFQQPKYRQQSVDDVLNDFNTNKHQNENINQKQNTILHGIEQTLENERQKAKETRILLENDLDQEKKSKRDIENKLRKLLEDMAEKSNVIRELQNAINQAKDENDQLNQALHNAKSEIVRVNEEAIRRTKHYEDSTRQQNWKQQQNEQKYTHEIERINQENKFSLDSLDKQWQFNYKALEEKCKNFLNIKNSLEEELEEVQQELQRTRLGCEEEIREKAIIIQEEENRKFQSNLKSFEHKLRSSEEALVNLTNKNRILIDDVSNKDRMLKEQDLSMTNAVNRYQQKIIDLQNEQNHLNIQRENISRDMNRKDNIIRKLEVENSEQKSTINNLRNQFQDDSSSLEQQIKDDKIMYEELNSKHQRKIVEQEQIIRQLNQEIESHKSEHERLRQQLTSNISRTIGEVIQDNGTNRQNEQNKNYKY